jgi:hypothetical protein
VVRSSGVEVGVDCSAVIGVGDLTSWMVDLGGTGVSDTAVRITEPEGDARLDVAVAGRAVKVREAYQSVAAGDPAVPIPGASHAADDNSTMDSNATAFKKAARNDISYLISC